MPNVFGGSATQSLIKHNTTRPNIKPGTPLQICKRIYTDTQVDLPILPYKSQIFLMPLKTNNLIGAESIHNFISRHKHKGICPQMQFTQPPKHDKIIHFLESYVYTKFFTQSLTFSYI